MIYGEFSRVTLCPHGRRGYDEVTYIIPQDMGRGRYNDGIRRETLFVKCRHGFNTIFGGKSVEFDPPLSIYLSGR
jgi:hypothetical protein